MALQGRARLRYVSTSNSDIPKQTNSDDDGFPGDVLVDLRHDQNRPLRERLEHALRSAIQQQLLAAGTALPPTRVLAAELGISRSVVVEAYRNLTADGYLETRLGAWTRVRPQPDPEASPTSEDPSDGEAAVFFDRPRPASLLRAQIRLLGGLPDPALFPRTRWLRHYRSALAELPDPQLTYPDIQGAEILRTALASYLGRVRGVATTPGRILVCAGVTQGLTLVCRALRRAGARRCRRPLLWRSPHGDRHDRTGTRANPCRRCRPRPGPLGRPGYRRGAGRAGTFLPQRRHAQCVPTPRARRLGAPAQRADHRGRLRCRVPLRPGSNRRIAGTRARPGHLHRLGQQDGDPGAPARMGSRSCRAGGRPCPREALR